MSGCKRCGDVRGNAEVRQKLYMYINTCNQK